MPGMISHFICGESTIAKLKKDNSQIILKNKMLFNIGTQGPDIFFYYIPSFFNKNTKMIGSILHEKNTGKYIETMIDTANEMIGKSKEEAIAYICGYITHYCLDCYAHPYVYCKTGYKSNISKKEKLKQLMNHRNFETNIDVSILKLINNQKPSDKRLHHFIKVKKDEAFSVSNMLSYSLNKVYNIKLTPAQIYNAMNYMKSITALLQSKTGKRKKMLSFLEDKTIGIRLYSAIIHPQDVDLKNDFLNLNKSLWFKPGVEDEKINNSFMDLFFAAVNESAHIINLVIDYFNGNVLKSEVVKAIGNRSLHSGFECK